MTPGILCGVDGTWRSCRPLVLADALAGRTGLRLEVLHATGAVGEEALRVRGERISALIGEVLGRRDVPVLLASGSPAGALVAAAGRASVLVLGSCGRSGVQQALRASTSAAVVRRSPRPAIVVPPNAPGALPRRRLVCAARDHRDLHVAATAACWARDLDAELVLAAAVRPPQPPAVAGIGVIPPPPSMTAQERLAMAELALGELAAAIEPIAPCRTRTILATASGGYALQQVLADEDASLAVVGAPTRGPLRAAMAGSASHLLLRRASCAVMVCPDPATALASTVGPRPPDRLTL